MPSLIETSLHSVLLMQHKGSFEPLVLFAIYSWLSFRSLVFVLVELRACDVSAFFVDSKHLTHRVEAMWNYTIIFISVCYKLC
jgi:hypothetical protein